MEEIFRKGKERKTRSETKKGGAEITVRQGWLEKNRTCGKGWGMHRIVY